MSDEAIARPTAQYPSADISPAEFEEFVLDLLGAARHLSADPRALLITSRSLT